jgi:dethiobiotin synthetase
MRGMFVTGTDTEVGKTYVAAAIVRALRQAAVRVGVYKPVASGCLVDGESLVSEDAVELWNAAERPLTLAAVCPQRFEAPLAPPVAAAEVGLAINDDLLLSGIEVWNDFELVVVEGAGGLLSPLSATQLNADVARQLNLPLIVVAANRLGVLNHTLMTLGTAARRELPVAGVVLSDVTERSDLSSRSNRDQLQDWCQREFSVPLLGHLRFGQTEFDTAIDWNALV